MPDPQFNLGFDKRLSGPDPSNGWTAALVYELNAFRTRGVERAAAKAAREQVRLDLAWQEWQVAGQARLLAARIAGLQRTADMAAHTRTLAEAMLESVLSAAARWGCEADEVETRRLAGADAADKARSAENALSAARL